jgi:hypothetical protein
VHLVSLVELQIHDTSNEPRHSRGALDLVPLFFQCYPDRHVHQFPKAIRTALSDVVKVPALVLIAKQEVLFEWNGTIRNSVTKILRWTHRH